jgi:hypothetical protein
MADDDEVNLSSDEDYSAITKKKRKAKATSSTHEPAIKKKKGPKVKKTRSKKAKYYDDSEDDFDDDSESREEEYGSSDGEEIPVARSDLAEISSDESEDSFDADLYRDASDRVMLAQMTDIERQAILYERAEKRNQIKERNSLKAQLRAARGLPPASKAAKRVAAPKRGSRAAVESAPARPVSGKRTALDALKEKRKASADAGQSRRNKNRDSDEDGEYDPSKEAVKAKAPPKETARAARLRLEAEAREQRARDRHRVDSDEEADASSHEVVYDELGKRVPLLAEVEQKDLTKMILRRDELVNWTTADFWEKTIKGAFVRASVGTDSSGNPIYRICEILDFNPDAKSYTVPVGPNRPPRTLTVSLKIAIGGTVKDQTLDLVSNGRITDEEFNDWVTRVKAQNLALPTKKTSLRVAKQIQKARNYVRTDADYEREMKRAEEMRAQRTHSQPNHDLRAARDSQSDIVSQINKRNRGVNSTVEAAYTPESAQESANNPFARLPTLTTTLGSKTASATPNKVASTSANAGNGTTHSTSANGPNSVGSSFSLDMDVSSSHSRSSAPSGSRGPSSYHDHAHASRGGASNPTSLMPAPKPAKVLTLAQYLNRR